MWRYDFHLFYLAGKAVLSGISPYAISDFYAPYPLAVVFALVAWMPEELAYSLYVAAICFMMWKILGRRVIWAVFSFPVFFNIFVGQIDLLLVLVSIFAGSWVLPLFIIKPQVGFVLAPWLIMNSSKKRLFQVSLLTVLFLVICFLIRPTWFSEWMAVIPTVTLYAKRDSNIYWIVPGQFKNIALIIGMIAAIPAGFLLKDRKLSMVLLQLFAPLTNIYSVSVLMEWIGPIEMLVSWIIILLVGGIHSGAPFFVIGLSILIRDYFQKRSKNVPKLLLY